VIAREPFTAIARASLVSWLLVIVLFAEPIFVYFCSPVGPRLAGWETVLRDPDTQWMCFWGMVIDLLALFFLRWKRSLAFWRWTNPSLWLGYVLLVSAVRNAVSGTPSTKVLIMLGGAVLGQSTLVWSESDKRKANVKRKDSLVVLVVTILVILLTAASRWQRPGEIVEYHSQVRWMGPWDDPNIFGLVMGTGAMLALGGVFAISRLQVAGEIGKRCASWKLPRVKYQKWIFGIAGVLMAVFMVHGLLRSYSRGAWVATFCGMGFLMAHKCRVDHPQILLLIRKGVLPGIIIMLSTFVLAAWEFEHTELIVGQRALSVLNRNDFSWKNRVAAWEGTLQIMVDQPCFGTGWIRLRALYEKYYAPSKINDAVGIQMNDYCLLGAMLGIPALVCFAAYLWLALTRKFEIGKDSSPSACYATDTGKIGLIENKSERREFAFLRIICRAGALVLAIGFSFDGGFFKLPTAVMFWILLELGRER
jgi:hypothetical protein